jgi:hypothetical protein
VAETVEKTGWQVHAWVWMSNLIICWAEARAFSPFGPQKQHLTGLRKIAAPHFAGRCDSVTHSLTVTQTRRRA